LINDYIVILSSTYGVEGSESYVTVLEKNNLPNYGGYHDQLMKDPLNTLDPQANYKYSAFTVTPHYKNNWYLYMNYPTKRTNIEWVDISSINETILIAQHPNKIGRLKIKKTLFNKRNLEGFWDYEEFTRIINKSKIKYKSTGKNKPMWFVKIPGEETVFLVYKTNENKFGHKKI
jgi:hypothetical protein